MKIPDGTATMPRSGIRAVMALALLKPGCIRLELGEPDFATPANIVEAAHRAALNGQTKYTATAGLPVLREALSAKIAERNGFDIAADRILVSTGAVEGIYASLVGLVEPGDGVLIPEPGWPNYRMMTRLLRARAQSYQLRPDMGYLPDVDELETLVDRGTKAIVLNSPSNPTGAVIPAERMSALLDFAARHDLWVVSDECYDELTYDVPHVSAATLDDRDAVISVFSFSKTYAMTGWRIGYVAVPKRVGEVLANMHEAMASCVAMPTQMAALEAVIGPQHAVESMRSAYRDRRDAVLARLSARGIPAHVPDGAFYVWLDVSAAEMDSHQLATRLVEEHGVAVAPGSAFGAGGGDRVRLSIAASQVDLLEGVDRISRALSDAAQPIPKGSTLDGQGAPARSGTVLTPTAHPVR